jgi:hypothetical protein
MYYSISWQDGMFNQTASILQFESKKERESFRLDCAQRVEPISSKDATKRQREGFRTWRMGQSKQTGRVSPLFVLGK